MRIGDKQIDLLMLGLLTIVLLTGFTSAKDGFQCFRKKFPGKTCRTPLTRYYYDLPENLCHTFKWGGCKDPDSSTSVNRFLTKTECEKKCRMYQVHEISLLFK
ncbi:PREDICTED: kappaPI-actitoxin-Avd3d-like [Drosophila arizonae]|uniref:KappaPI-actitoxin-Avd3d-like n=1 Tax=Drosophila arizonae TaxID=7263 RepID=A0ABM1NQU4_DROAR|nr:PREDICTED: kappaPI-actitoxin-Avd3d-like [Drosophila arizonae]